VAAFVEPVPNSSPGICKRTIQLASESFNGIVASASPLASSDATLPRKRAE
jgi:hypothetical protein